MWWLTVAALAAAPCDTQNAAGVLDTLRTIDSGTRAGLAAAYLSEACRLPGPLDKTLAQVAMVGPQEQTMVVLRAAAEDPALLVAACTGGPAALAGVVSLARDQHRKYLWEKCGLQRYAAVDRATFEAATLGDPILYMLVAQAVGPTTEPVLVEAIRAIAGAPPSAAK